MEGEYAARLQKLGHQKFNLAGHEKTRINYLVQIDYVPSYTAGLCKEAGVDKTWARAHGLAHGLARFCPHPKEATEATLSTKRVDFKNINIRFSVPRINTRPVSTCSPI